MKIALLALSCALCVSGEVMATVVYDSGAVLNPGSGIPVGPGMTADDFQLSSNATIKAASVALQSLVGGSLGTPNLGLWDGTLQWSLYTDGPTTPGNGPSQPASVIASGNALNISRILTSSNPDPIAPAILTDEFYTVSFDFGQNVDLTAGQHYWFGIHLGQANNDFYVYWRSDITSDSVLSRAQSFLNGHWNAQGIKDQAFTLNANGIPAPGTAAILGLGCLAMRRKRSAR